MNFFYNMIMVIALAASNYAWSIELFRADSRPPADIIRAKGLLSKGQDNNYDRGTPPNINLFSHVTGTEQGNVRFDDGFVSTTRSFNSAHIIGQNMFGGMRGYYIYVIAPAPNMISVNDALGRYSPHPFENEVAALGGIPISQIIGWYTIRNGAVQGGMEVNRLFRRRVFDALTIMPTEDAYRFAGFPAGHEAWQRLPWSLYVPEGCQGPNTKRDLGTCQLNVYQVGIKKLNEIKSHRYKNSMLLHQLMDDLIDEL